MPNLDRALAWAKLGCPVFPCYEADTWVGDNLHTRKSPRTSKGFKEAVTDLEVITKYWTANPEHLVGVVPKAIVVLDIDMNSFDGKDGWFELNEAGIEVPDTFSVETPSGGNHYFFRAEDGETIPPAAGLTLENGIRLPSVDRRSGGSYFIAWSEDTPPSLTALTDCPDWLMTRRGNKSHEYISFAGGVRTWLEALEPGDPSRLVALAIARFPEAEFGHGTLISKQAELVHLGAARESGVKVALSKLQSLWLAGKYDTLRYRADWESGLAGAISKFGGQPTQHMTEKEMHEALTKKYLEEFRAKREAERILAAEDYEGLEVVGWDDLGATKRSYLVEDLVPKESIVFFVAKSNMGKTFAYIDMICRMQFEMPWLGKATIPTRTLVVLGEGMSGIKERFDSWCSVNGKPEGPIRENILIATRANLSSDLSLQHIKEVATQHQAELIIYDTWSNVSGVPSEDDAALNAAALRNITNTLPSTTHFFVHHPRKSSEDTANPVMRGSSVLPGRSDVVMTMFRDKEYISARGLTADFLAVSTESSHAGKNRDAMTETIRGAYVQTVGDCVAFTFDEDPPLPKRVSLVTSRLKERMTVKEYAAKYKLSDTGARRDLKAGVEAGLVIEEKSRNPSIATSYSPKTYQGPSEDIDWKQLLDRF